MGFIDKLLSTWRHGGGLPIWYDPAYRLPISGLEGATGIDPRRADFVAWYLVQTEAAKASQLKTPEPVSYQDLGLVHDAAYLESLARPETLARIIGVSPSMVPVDEVLHSVRLACGATISATLWALEHSTAALNLLGGFHHAGPDFGSDLCPVNDVATALAVVRKQGFEGRVAVIDLDAHRPDGTAACHPDSERVWIGSISTSASGLPNVHTFSVPVQADNHTYREAFERLLGAMPEVQLAFVIAGGDVLAGDRFGNLGLNLNGARHRDRAMARHLRGVPSVWLPGGGYHRNSWKVLAGTARVLIDGSVEPIEERYDPMGERFARLSAEFSESDTGAKQEWISADDLVEALRLPGPREVKLLGKYSTEAIEVVLEQFGILPHLRRLGYDHFRIVLDSSDSGDRVRLYGSAQDAEHLLIECLLAIETIASEQMLYVHWLTLRNPIAAFSGDRRKLPGQEVPGLGLAREAGEMLMRIARRLKLLGLAYRPAWYHTAYAGRYNLRFVDSARQGRFEALMRDGAGKPLLEVTKALSEDRVLLDGQPYTWEATAMAVWIDGPPADGQTVAAERDRVRFEFLD